MGKLLISHRYNRIPLLNSLPGGFYRSWSYKTYPSAKVTLFSKSAKRKRKIRKKESPCGASASRNRGNDKGKQPDTRAPRRSERNGSVRISPAIRVSPTTARRFERAEAPPRQAPPRQNRKLRLLLRSACTLCGNKPRLDRRRLGKTTNFVCFCARLARFAEDKPPLRQAAPRQNRKLRLLLRSACTLCGGQASA